jgi:hypothetical protein
MTKKNKKRQREEAIKAEIARREKDRQDRSPQNDDFHKQSMNELESPFGRFEYTEYTIDGELVNKAAHSSWQEANRLLKSDTTKTTAQETLDKMEAIIDKLGPENKRFRAHCLETASKAAHYAGDFNKSVKFAKEALNIINRIKPTIWDTGRSS